VRKGLKVSSLFYKEREKREGRKERERGKNVMMARKWREGRRGKEERM
jgi:hypothetical protein